MNGASEAGNKMVLRGREYLEVKAADGTVELRRFDSKSGKWVINRFLATDTGAEKELLNQLKDEYVRQQLETDESPI
ncbi:hypothetical protein [Paenibacillus sp. YN15]|uniref:hypothetical protein n=1 Tax=Paenibacillus sp. YN15 TaxID=1742774 RepID=UPI000DCCF07F|nr:hypothetical protein [Paenibacillus sp. YN15]RAV06620.1 hypothetical protein DQG13_01980 [Paenibacillus sp. YN15]